MSKRIKTDYPGVFYREVNRIGGEGAERVYYVVFKKDGKVIEEKAGRQYADKMSPYKANQYRSQRIEQRRPSRKEIREARKVEKAKRWTVENTFEAYQKEKGKYSTRYTDKSNFKHLEKPFGKKEFESITPLDVDRLRLSLTKTHSPQTVRHVIRLLVRLSNFAQYKGWSPGLSFKPKQPRVDNEKIEMLTAEQLNRLLQAVDASDHPQAPDMMRLCLCTGMRKKELYRLRWDDVDFEHRSITIREAKSGKTERIPLNDAAANVLKKHPRTSKFVFPGRRGKMAANYDKAVRAIRDAAKLPKTFRPFHGIRHHFASTLASSGAVTLHEIQKLLTHKEYRTTQRYAHLVDAALQKASNVAGASFDESVRKAKKNANKKTA